MAESTRKTRREHSSGGAVMRVSNRIPQVAMIATKGRIRWGLPKGAVMDGETSEEAALREVKEETGIDARIVAPLDTIEYFFRAGDTLIQKTVDFYFMQYVDGVLNPQLSEVDDCEWVELDEAINRSSFESEKKLLIQIRESWSRLDPSERDEFELSTNPQRV